MHAFGRTILSLALMGSVSCGALADDAKPAPKSAPAGAASAWSQEVAPAGAAGVSLDAQQTATVKQISDFFANLDGLKGTFVQTDAQKKRMRGKFFVKRPGKFRFDYAPPSRQIIISDGQYLAIQDLDLNNEDRVSLDQTPFRLLLRKDVDLLRDAKIFEVQQSGDLVVIGLEDKNPDAPGKIKLFFSMKPELELKEWVTTDAQGLDTRVQLSSLQKTAEIDANLFKIQHLGSGLSTPR